MSVKTRLSTIRLVFVPVHSAVYKLESTTIGKKLAQEFERRRSIGEGQFRHRAETIVDQKTGGEEELDARAYRRRQISPTLRNFHRLAISPIGVHVNYVLGFHGLHAGPE